MEVQDTNEKTVVLSLFEKYHKEIGDLVKIDEFNMKQVQMDLPANRHYWVGRLMHHKGEVTKLKKTRLHALSKIKDKLASESPVVLTPKTLEVSAEQHPLIQKIDEQIAENEILIEYLGKIESNFRSISYDIKNLIDIVKLETT